MTVVDRAVLAAYCQCYGRWVEAEQKMAETPLLVRTPGGYVQQSPWLSIANRQMELMGRFMAELGLTPAARARLAVDLGEEGNEVSRVEIVIVTHDSNGVKMERPLDYSGTPQPWRPALPATAEGKRIEISEDI